MKYLPVRLAPLTLLGASLLALWGTQPPDDAAPRASASHGRQEFWVLRNVAKDALAGEAAAVRRSLLEVAALFGALNRLPPAVDGPLPAFTARVDIPTDTEEGRLCWQVAVWAEVNLRHAPPRRARAAVARLVAEYRAAAARPGGVRLPDPAALESAEALLSRAWESLTEDRRQVLFGPPLWDRAALADGTVTAED